MTCNVECLVCANFTDNCSSCASGFVNYYNATTQTYKCLTTCPSGTFNSTGTCAACISPCLTCQLSQSACQTCLSGFLVLNTTSMQCVSQCPSNGYAYQSECILCNSDCILCDGSGCIQCAAAFYQDQGQTLNGTIYHLCYSACPTNFPYLINTTCSKCTQNCRICNTTSCL